MTWEDPSSQFIQQFDRSISSNPQETVHVNKKTFQYRLKSLNGYFLPLIAHFMVAIALSMIGLYKDVSMRPLGYNTFSFLILGLVFLFFPLSFLFQRKVENRRWTSACLRSTLCSCCTDPDEEDFLYENQEEDEEDYSVQPSRVYERLYKYLAFNESPQAQIDESSSIAALPFTLFHIWLAYCCLYFWACLTFKMDFNIKTYTIPTYILLSLTLATSLKGPYGHKIYLAASSIIFLISTIIFSSKYHPDDASVQVLQICAPLFAFPAILLFATIFTWIFTNSKFLGIFMVALTLVFSLWFFFMLGFLHNFFNPESQISFLSFPLLVAMIPAYLILFVSFLSLHIQFSQ